MAEHWSDCSVHNEPMSPGGPCDCTPTRSLLLREAEIADLRVVLNVVRHCAEEHKSPTAQDVDDEVARLARALSPDALSQPTLRHKPCPQCLHGWHGCRVCRDANCCSCRLTWRDAWKRATCRAGVTTRVPCGAGSIHHRRCCEMPPETAPQAEPGPVTVTAAPSPGALTLLRDGMALVAQGDATQAEWVEWGARVEWFLLDYDAAVAAIKARTGHKWHRQHPVGWKCCVCENQCHKTQPCGDHAPCRMEAAHA